VFVNFLKELDYLLCIDTRLALALGPGSDSISHSYDIIGGEWTIVTPIDYFVGMGLEADGVLELVFHLDWLLVTDDEGVVGLFA
jgi:hypothetical protein